MNLEAPSTDEQLHELSMRGDASAFEDVYDRRQAGIYRFALRMTGSVTMAEDITQDVFLSYLRDGKQFDATRGSVKSYLYGIARHRTLRCLDRERSISNLTTVIDDNDSDFEQLLPHTDPFSDLEREQVVQVVRQAILSLPAHFREVIVLCHLQEMNYAEAAEIIECPIGTVRSRLNRARTLLLEKLESLNPAIAAKQLTQEQGL